MPGNSLITFKSRTIVLDQDDPVKRTTGRCSLRLLQCNGRSEFHGIAVYPAADGRKGDTADAMPASQFQAVAVRGGQQLRFAFVPGQTKLLIQAGEAGTLPGPLLTGTTFLERVMLLTDSELFRMELSYLVNTALVADQAHLADTDQIKSVVARVYGYLNIALEQLCRGDEAKGVEILTGEHLKRLFQLGFSIVLGLKFKADRLSDTSYATGKVLLGLKSARPRYYRGLDPDGIDDYREFRELQDVRNMADFLAELKA